MLPYDKTWWMTASLKPWLNSFHGRRHDASKRRYGSMHNEPASIASCGRTSRISPS